VADPRLAELRAEIEHCRRRLEAIVGKLARARRETIPTIGKTDDSALIVAGYLETYYTTLETLFVRVSQHFENSLPPNRWHSALLEKMALSIPGLREPAVSEANLPRLRELLRFRHFRRAHGHARVPGLCRGDRPRGGRPLTLRAHSGVSADGRQDARQSLFDAATPLGRADACDHLAAFLDGKPTPEFHFGQCLHPF
jgi:hypothetical protein